MPESNIAVDGEDADGDGLDDDLSADPERYEQIIELLEVVWQFAGMALGFYGLGYLQGTLGVLPFERLPADAAESTPFWASTAAGIGGLLLVTFGFYKLVRSLKQWSESQSNNDDW